MKLQDAWVVRYGDVWWRAERAGYTSDLLAAGVYTQEEAERCAHVRSPHVWPDGHKTWPDTAIRLVDAFKGVGKGTVGELLGLLDDDQEDG